jgi:hypothetical protein
LEGPTGERHFVAVDAGLIFLRDYMPVRVDFGIAENGGDAIFKTLGNEVLQPLRFLVDFIPGVPQNIVKEQFEQAVMAYELPGAALSGGREPNAPVLLIHNEGGPL